ncbi:MAG: membrane protein insertion efficiency factor YidD [Planctomycetaceae bacterium]|nr:membrane protein insertion efficiency factor YidD [Planctomycetaceae bacterium]
MTALLLGTVRFYQKYISPLKGPCCRFQPTCSQYFIDAVEKYGPLQGSWKGLCRLARCHPFGSHGHDPA